MDKFKQRLISSSLALAILFLFIYFSHVPYLQPVFILFSAITTCVALKEFYHLAQLQGFKPLKGLAYVCTLCYAIAAFVAIQSPTLQLLPQITLFAFMMLFFASFFTHGSHPLANLSISLFGILYLTIPLTCAVQINFWSLPESFHDGRIALAYVLLVTKATDIGAYFIGKGFGRIKLAPFLSPKKTVEGAIGGWITSILTSLAFYNLLPLSIWQNILLATILSAVSQFGDLAESLLKRDAGVKDSSQMPGLGGMLDIVDSLVFTLPLMLLLLKTGWI